MYLLTASVLDYIRKDVKPVLSKLLSEDETQVVRLLFGFNSKGTAEAIAYGLIWHRFDGVEAEVEVKLRLELIDLRKIDIERNDVRHLPVDRVPIYRD